jgi:hypothetical protein
MAISRYLQPRQPGGQQPQEEQSQDEQEQQPSYAEPPAKRLDARPKNNIYAPGTGPGTGRTAIRIGTQNRDGSLSPVSALGAATGPLSQPIPRLLMPRAAPGSTSASAFAQRQDNVSLAKANGTFDSVRDKFHAANPGQVMDGNGNISQRSTNGQAAPAKTEFAQAPDGQGGYKNVPVPPKPAPAETAAPTPAVTTPAEPTVPSFKFEGFPGAEPIGKIDPNKPLGNPLPPSPLGRRAKGGPVKAARPYLVGERGPEIIVPKHSGTVVPNHALKAAVQDEELMQRLRNVKAQKNLDFKVKTPSGIAAARG